MRNRDDIQAAHDLLVAMLLRHVPRSFPDESEDAVNAAAAALCWVLEHDHASGATFADNLRQMREYLAECGYVEHRIDLEPNGTPQS